MNPLIKKALTAFAIAKAIGKIRDMRKPKKTMWSRMKPLVGIAGLGGGVFYLNQTGKLQPMIAKAKDMTTNTKNGSVMEDSLRETSSSRGV